MKKSKKDKQLENLLFEVYEKGVNNEDCDLTAYIEKVKKVLTIHSVMCRLLFLTLIPVYVFNIVFAGLMLLPYWIITSKVYYDTKHIQSFNNWWFDLIDKPSYK